MRFRAFRKISTDEWTDALMTVAGGAFDIPAASHIESIAGALAIPIADLEAVEGKVDPRTPPFLALPKPPAPPDPNQEIMDDLGKLAAGDTKDILVKIVERL